MRYIVSITIEGVLDQPDIDEEGAYARAAEVASALKQLAQDIELEDPWSTVDVEQYD